MKRKTAKRKKCTAASRTKKNLRIFKKPNTARQYSSLSPKNQKTWDSIGHVISEIREGRTLRKTAKELSLSPKTVITLGRSALRKQKNGRYVAKKTDRLLRVVNALTNKGRKEIATRDSRQASFVGSHWAAVQRYIQIGDDSALQRFKNKKITDAKGKRHLLLTDLNELDRLGRAGVLRFESMYAGGSR